MQNTKILILKKYKIKKKKKKKTNHIYSIKITTQQISIGYMLVYINRQSSEKVQLEFNFALCV